MTHLEETDAFMQRVAIAREWMEDIDLGNPKHDLFLGRMASRMGELLEKERASLLSELKEEVKGVKKDLDNPIVRVVIARWEGFNSALDSVLSILEENYGK